MMYRILNDYSLSGQFETLHHLFDSLLEYTIPLFTTIERYGIELAKSERFWQLPALKSGTSLFEILNIKGHPEISKFKTLLHRRLTDEPYWQESFAGQNCLDKARELSKGLVSFEHDAYLIDEVIYRGCRLSNCYQSDQLYEQLRRFGAITTGEYLLNRYKRILTFCVLNNKDYFAEFLRVNIIDQLAEQQILNDLIQFMEMLENNHDLGRLTGNIKGNLHEFRTTIPDGRQIRILYCHVGPKVAFLNCFVKKQQTTPVNEKRLGEKLKDQALAMASGGN